MLLPASVNSALPAQSFLDKLEWDSPQQRRCNMRSSEFLDLSFDWNSERYWLSGRMVGFRDFGRNACVLELLSVFGMDRAMRLDRDAPIYLAYRQDGVSKLESKNARDT